MLAERFSWATRYVIANFVFLGDSLTFQQPQLLLIFYEFFFSSTEMMKKRYTVDFSVAMAGPDKAEKDGSDFPKILCQQLSRPSQ